MPWKVQEHRYSSHRFQHQSHQKGDKLVIVLTFLLFIFYNLSLLMRLMLKSVGWISSSWTFQALAKKAILLIFLRDLRWEESACSTSKWKVACYSYACGSRGAIIKKKRRWEQYIPEFPRHFYAFVKKKFCLSICSCHYFLSGIVGVDIKKTFGIPLVITFHTLGLHEKFGCA